jgi:hypothetical protein
MFAAIRRASSPVSRLVGNINRNFYQCLVELNAGRAALNIVEHLHPVFHEPIVRALDAAGLLDRPSNGGVLPRSSAVRQVPTLKRISFPAPTSAVRQREP